jgi:hypothetical protein
VRTFDRWLVISFWLGIAMLALWAGYALFGTASAEP